MNNWPKIVAIKQDLFNLQKGRCLYCRTRFKFHQEMVLEHIVPISKGGKDVPDNRVLACMICNSSKSNLSIQDWFVSCKNKKIHAYREYSYRKTILISLKNLLNA